MKLERNTFLVTGASSGLGEGSVKRLVGEGANVVGIDLNVERGESLASEVGENFLFLKADITSEEEIKNVLGKTKERFGSLQGVINCAGVVLARKTLSRKGVHDLDSFSRVIKINLIGSFNVLRLAAELMAGNEPNEEGERGIIINTASVAAFDGQIGQPAYAASKGGIVSMTLPLAREFASLGIRVMAIAPGIFDTSMLGELSEEIRHSLASQVPFPSRLGKADEFASLAAQIIENPMLNGEIIRLDGAIRMAPK